MIPRANDRINWQLGRQHVVREVGGRGVRVRRVPLDAAERVVDARRRWTRLAYREVPRVWHELELDGLQDICFWVFILEW